MGTFQIDFGESHCCLIRTDYFRGSAAELFLEDMHNTFTMAVATQRIHRQSQCRMLIEPKAVVSILPIGFGYDIPWLFECYNNLAMFKVSLARSPAFFLAKDFLQRVRIRTML